MNFIKLALFTLCAFYSCVLHAWELYKITSCNGYNFNASSYDLCLPKDFYIESVDEESITMSSVRKIKIVFYFRAYDIDEYEKRSNGLMVFREKVENSKGDIYVHQSDMADNSFIVYSWVLPIKNENIYMKLNSPSEDELKSVLNEIILKRH